MLTQEEIKFNKSKQDFDRAYERVKAVKEFYDRTWYSDELRKSRGVTEEAYKRLEELEKYIQNNIPTRGLVVQRTIQRSSQDEQGQDAPGDTEQEDLPTVQERTSFFANLTNYIRNLFKRIFNNRDEDEYDYDVSADTSDEKVLEEDSEHDEDIDFPYRRDDEYYDVEKIMSDYRDAYNYLVVASTELDMHYRSRLDETPRGKVIERMHDGPGILDDYRQTSWGIERICLDGFQNHLPMDSKGTQCYLHFKVNGKWVDVETAREQRDKITEVRFSDNGVGFTPDNLFFLHSTKTSEDSSAGQFGEGMKLASIAAVKLGLGLEFQSRNWIARATSEEQRIINTRNNDEEEKRRKLVYDVEIYDGEPIVGSRTIFHTPTPGFIDYALDLPSKVMSLGGITPYFTHNGVSIINLHRGGEAFVKGIFLTEIDSFFSYNFDDANVNPDRNGFHNYDSNYYIHNALARLDNVDYMTILLSKVLEYTEEKKLYDNPYYHWDPHPVEIGAAGRIQSNLPYDPEGKNPIKAKWREALERAVAEMGYVDENGNPKKPVLKTDYEIPEYLQDKLDGYAVIRLTKSWTTALKEIGIPTDRDIIPEYIEDIIQTPLSIDYGDEVWDEQRIVLDASQNHLPSDSKGTSIFLRFQTVDGLWHDYREFDKYEDGDIVKVKLSDDGVGYDSKNLELFASVKDHSGSSGKWGEGLKMLSLAAVRAGIQMELRSRDWIAFPETQTEIVNEGKSNEKEITRLVYRVRKRVDPDSTILDDGESTMASDYGFTKSREVSSTTFINPTPELIKEFRNIRDSVLTFSPRTPLAEAEGAEILETSGGKLYIRNILVPGDHQLKFSYHLKDFDIETRDRDVIKRESMKKMMKKILETTEDEKFISEFLSGAVAYAQQHGRESFLEFETIFDIPQDSELADKWVKVFKHKFGERTSIRNAGDQNFNAYHQARHLGLDMITLPNAVEYSLRGLRGKDGQKIASYEESLRNATENVTFLPEEDLTEREKKVLGHLFHYNKVLSLVEGSETPIREIHVYEYPADYNGERAAGFASRGNRVNINRDTLNNGIIEAGDVFFHESGHAMTGAEDADAMFRDYMTRLLSVVAERLFPLQESVDDNGVAQDVSTSDINKALDMLRLMLTPEDKSSRGNKDDGEEFGDQ